MRQPLNHAQRLLAEIKKRDITLQVGTADIKMPVPMKPIKTWDGKDSLDALMASSSASKYTPGEKAAKVLGMASK